jgi:hypothetical protein
MTKKTMLSKTKDQRLAGLKKDDQPQGECTLCRRGILPLNVTESSGYVDNFVLGHLRRTGKPGGNFLPVSLSVVGNQVQRGK